MMRPASRPGTMIIGNYMVINDLLNVAYGGGNHTLRTRDDSPRDTYEGMLEVKSLSTSVDSTRKEEFARRRISINMEQAFVVTQHFNSLYISRNNHQTNHLNKMRGKTSHKRPFPTTCRRNPNSTMETINAQRRRQTPHPTFRSRKISLM